MSVPILVSGGAGYIGSHTCLILKQRGFLPIVIDNLVTGNDWAVRFGPFEKGDISDQRLIKDICQKYKPLAAIHFAAFIEVSESVQNPHKYFENNRDKAGIFFETLHLCGVDKIVFSSSAAVYGEPAQTSEHHTEILETSPTCPINPYGRSKLEAETRLRKLDEKGLRSVCLRYFNVAGAAPPDAQIGEAHTPESHLIPRLILPLINIDRTLLAALGLEKGFQIFGHDYPTRDGTAIRDYVHVLDLGEAHILALNYLLKGGNTDIINLGSSHGFSVKEIVAEARQVLDCCQFDPPLAPRREGDPAILVASSEKARKILGWVPSRSLQDILSDAAKWHRTAFYAEAIRKKMGL